MMTQCDKKGRLYLEESIPLQAVRAGQDVMNLDVVENETNPLFVREYPNGVLIGCQNLTVNERLQILRSEISGSYEGMFGRLIAQSD